MAKMRHWRQHFDPAAKYVWRRPAKRADGTFAQPGDEVDKAVVGHRLKRLWQLERIEIKDWVDPAVKAKQQAPTPKKTKAKAKKRAAAPAAIPPPPEPNFDN